jgi:hypothetical protein
LKLIKGSHLLRSDFHRDDPAANRPALPDAVVPDEVLEADDGPLAHRTHPATGERLVVTRLHVPPGSMVAVLSWGAHAVEPKETAVTRLACIIGYNNGGMLDCPWSKPAELPTDWVQRRDRGELTPTLTRMLSY